MAAGGPCSVTDLVGMALATSCCPCLCHHGTLAIAPTTAQTVCWLSTTLSALLPPQLFFPSCYQFSNSMNDENQKSAKEDW
jgi:hypothetical protein